MIPTCAFRLLAALWLGYCVIIPAAQAERIKDLASVQGMRSNQLVGYGLVVGLDGTGDQTIQTPFTIQTLNSMLMQMGINVPPGTNMRLRNVAAVMVTAVLPPLAQPGQVIDVTVSSMGNARSLRGGTLLMTPLKGADGQVYGMAQGNLLVGGFGASASGSKVQVNHLSVGRITGGATVERAVPVVLGQDDTIRLELNTTDFSTTRRVVDAVNARFGEGTALGAGWPGDSSADTCRQRPARGIHGRNGELEYQPCPSPGQGDRQQPNRFGRDEPDRDGRAVRYRSWQFISGHQHRARDQPTRAIFQRTHSAGATLDHRNQAGIGHAYDGSGHVAG